jgi:hypothetical protein
MDEIQIISPVYRQKSQLFLWPLLTIPRRLGFRPLKTFIRDPFSHISEDDCKLIAVFPKDNSINFGAFEEEALLANPFYLEFYETADFLVYIFDLSPYQLDYDLFLKGKYSKMSPSAKLLINDYYSKSHGLKKIYHPQIKAYLSPTEKIQVQVAEQLAVNIYDIIAIGEIIDAPNLDRETFDESKISKDRAGTDTKVSN